ncbi:hypothetical protein [Brevundimonas lutea]|uniref:hypothetical protein n=1 Tax=Brevundimonas lutea TaxID=2293980 RepID=UPI000F02A933|nr:hypothetical protein [Brevundimonas lutea]
MDDKLAEFLIDAGLVLGVYLIAATALVWAYGHAGRLWLLRHGVISNNADGHRDVWPGEFGELVIVTLAMMSAWVVIFFTNDVTLVGMLAMWPLGALAFLAFVSFWVVLHCRLEVARAKLSGRPPIYCGRLAGTYRIYNIYSICLFGMGAMIVMMLIAQFMHDGAIFAAESRRITENFETARLIASAATPEAYAQAIATAEQGFSGIALSGKALQNQFNPMFVFAGTLIMINIAINMTSLKAMFTGGAVSMTAIFTYGPLVIIGAVGLWVYLNHYETMLTASLTSLQAFTPPASLADWQMSNRHAEMVTELSNARNIFGFATTVAGEGGGFAILAWGVQTALEKIGDTGDKEPVHMPLRKFRPHDGRYAWTLKREERAQRRRTPKAQRPVTAWRRLKFKLARLRRSPQENERLARLFPDISKLW